MDTNEVTQLQSEAVELASWKYWLNALEINKKIIQLDRTNWMAWSRSAKCYTEINDIINAIKIYKYLLKIAPVDKVDIFTIKIKALEKVKNCKGKYINHCFNCNTIITDALVKCTICEWYKCEKCSSCKCNYGN